MAVKVVTDSAADLPPAMAKELGITVVPLNIHFGTEVYRDGVEILPGEFYNRLTASPRLQTTSQPTVGDFMQSYQGLSQITNEIVSIHIPAKLSKTLNSANQAMEQSQQGSLELGMVAIAANQAAQRVASMDEVVKEAELAIPSVQLFVLLDTLEYLQKGGRIGNAQAFVWSLLRIKPILVFRDGEALPLEWARTRDRGIDRLCGLVEEHMTLADLAVVYATTPDDAHALANRLRPFLPDGEVFISQVWAGGGDIPRPGSAGRCAERKGRGSRRCFD